MPIVILTPTNAKSGLLLAWNNFRARLIVVIMGDTDATAMARMTAEVEEEEVDVMELVRRLQESRSEGMRDEPGTGASATAAKAHEKGFASMVKTTGVATLDEESKKGQFGWFPVLGVQMPYIIRSETPYIPTKVKQDLLNL